MDGGSSSHAGLLLYGLIMAFNTHRCSTVTWGLWFHTSHFLWPRLLWFLICVYLLSVSHLPTHFHRLSNHLRNLEGILILSDNAMSSYLSGGVCLLALHSKVISKCAVFKYDQPHKARKWHSENESAHLHMIFGSRSLLTWGLFRAL